MTKSGQKPFHSLCGVTLNAQNGAPVVVVNVDCMDPDCSVGVNIDTAYGCNDELRILLECTNCDEEHKLPCSEAHGEFAQKLTSHKEIHYYCYFGDDDKAQEAIDSDLLAASHADLHMVRQLKKGDIRALEPLSDTFSSQPTSIV